MGCVRQENHSYAYLIYSAPIIQRLGQQRRGEGLAHTRRAVHAQHQGLPGLQVLHMGAHSVYKLSDGQVLWASMRSGLAFE